MATSPPPLPPTPKQMSPLAFGSLDDAVGLSVSGGGIEQWLNLDQAGEPIGDAKPSNFMFPDKFSSVDFGRAFLNPEKSNVDSFFGVNNEGPSNADTPFILDPSAFFASYQAAPETMGADTHSASPITFSPASSSSAHNALSDIHQSDNGSIAGGVEPFPAALIPFAVDPKLTAPKPQLQTTAESMSPSLPSAATKHRRVTPILQEDSDDEDDETMGVAGAPIMVAGSSPAFSGSGAPIPVRKGQLHPHALVEVPDWTDKPSAEEYKKMSSKEKRQVRNKISARNFRHRRKEHISTLETQVAQRDELIDGLRSELTQVRTENKELRGEVDLLKGKWADLMRKLEEMSASAIGAASSALSSSSATPVSPKPRMTSRASSGTIPMPNFFKDVGAHSMKAFNGTGGMAGGNVGVYTTLIPETHIDPYSRPRNMNPALNKLSAAERQKFEKGLFTQHLRGSVGAAGFAPADDFMDSNPVHLSPQALLEMKRQMYGKMAHNAPVMMAAEKGEGFKIPKGFKPAFFNPPSTAAPSPKAVASSKPSIAFSPKFFANAELVGKEPRDSSSTCLTAFIESEVKARRDQKEVEVAAVGALAASTLFARMANLFLDAFRPAGPSSEVDTAKVAAVLEGRSEVKVVEKAPPPYSSSPAATTIDAAVETLSTQLRGMNVGLRPGSPLPSPGNDGCVRTCAMTAWAAQREALAAAEERRPRSPTLTK